MGWLLADPAAAASCPPAAARDGAHPLLWRVAAELRSRRGYAVKIRRALGSGGGGRTAGGPAAYLHQLRHGCILLASGGGDGKPGARPRQATRTRHWPPLHRGPRHH